MWNKRTLLIISGILILVSFLLSFVLYNFSIKEVKLSFANDYDFRFQWKNSNGSLPLIKNDSVFFSGSDKTFVYQDAVAIEGINIINKLVLTAYAKAHIENYSTTSDDQFAIFATDDKINYNKDEFGFVLYEDVGKWNTYIQNSKTGFAAKSIDTLNLLDEFHEFKAIFSQENSISFITFYIDSKPVERTQVVTPTNKTFYLVMTSHKISQPSINLSNNYFEIKNASLKNYDDYTSDFEIFSIDNFWIFLLSPVFYIITFSYKKIYSLIIDNKIKTVLMEREDYEKNYFSRKIDEETFKNKIFYLQEELSRLKRKKDNLN